MKYEKSYEKKCDDIAHEPLVSAEPDYKMVITDASKRRLKWVLKFMKELAEIWNGTIKISYEENDPIRDYIICVTVDVMDLCNRYLAQDFGELMRDIDFCMIRSYPKDRNKVEIIVIQSNAEQFPEDEEVDFEDEM